jgi:U3 small nucleolar RNA-associated protein 7
MPPREDVKLRGELRRRARLDRSAAHAAKDTRQLLGGQAGFLEAEGELERTFKVTQHELAQNLDVAAARQSWSLALGESAPYAVRYSRNGRHLLMGGARGHLSLLDALRTTLVTELHLGEPLRDVCFLHNETMLAAAQRKYVYIYDSSGVEIHCIRQHIEPHRLQFLPHHFLLASVGNAGYLKYHDVSVGNLVAEHRTKLGVCDCMTQNPQNAVVHLGHANGVVSRVRGDDEHQDAFCLT